MEHGIESAFTVIHGVRFNLQEVPDDDPVVAEFINEAGNLDTEEFLTYIIDYTEGLVEDYRYEDIPITSQWSFSGDELTPIDGRGQVHRWVPYLLVLNEQLAGYRAGFVPTVIGFTTVFGDQHLAGTMCITPTGIRLLGTDEACLTRGYFYPFTIPVPRVIPRPPDQVMRC